MIMAIQLFPAITNSISRKRYACRVPSAWRRISSPEGRTPSRTASTSVPSGRRCFAQPVHALPVLFLQGRLFAPYELVVAAHAAGMEGFEHLAAVERAAAGDRHRHGVGQCGVERTLVDVDADARDRPREGRARIAVFDEDADQFFVADIDVVRPFDAGVDAEGGEGVRKRQRDGFGEQELFADGQEHGFEHQREGEVLAFGAAVRPRRCRRGGIPAAWRRRWSRWFLRCGKSCYCLKSSPRVSASALPRSSRATTSPVEQSIR